MLHTKAMSGKSLLVSCARDEYVDVHLACDGGERLCIAGRNDLVAVEQANLERTVLDYE